MIYKTLTLVMILFVAPLSANDLLDRARAYYDQGKEYERTKENRDARYQYEKAAALYAKAEDWKQFLKTERRISKIYAQRENRPKQAVANLEAAIKKAKPYFTHHPDFIKSLRYRAEYYNHIGDWNDTFDAYNDAITAAKPHQPATSIEMAYCYGGIGKLYRDIGDWANSAYYYRRDAEILEQYLQEDLYQKGSSYYNLAIAYQELNLLDSATYFYQKAIPLWLPKFGENFQYLGYIYNALGTIALEQNDQPSALDYFSKATKIQLANNKGTSDDGGQLTQAGDAATLQGDTKMALQFYQQALATRNQTLGAKNPVTIACHTYIAKAYQRQGDTDKALKECQKALSKFANVPINIDYGFTPSEPNNFTAYPYFLDVLILKTDLLAHQISSDIAYETVLTTISVIDRVRQQSQSVRSKLYWTQEVMGFYENGLAICYELYQATENTKYLETALVITEKSKALLLRENLQAAEAQLTAGLPPQLTAQERQLKSDISQYQVYLTNEEKKCEQADQQKLKLWTAALQKQREAYDIFLNDIKNQYPEYYQLRYALRYPTIADVQSQLNDATAILTYFSGYEAVYSLQIDAQEARLSRVTIDSDFEDKIVAFRQATKDYDYIQRFPQAAYDDLVQYGQELYDILLREQLTNTAATNIIIVPDSRLSTLPFDILLSQSPTQTTRNYKNLPYLIQQFTTSYYNSVALWHQDNLYHKNTTASTVYTGFAPSYGQSEAIASLRQGLQPLAYNQEEVQFGASIFKGKLWIDEAANEQNFYNATPTKVLHLAMHAVLDTDNPMYSALIFTDTPDSIYDNVVYAYEIYNMNLKTDLAVLSACNTGLGKVEKGEGLMSLARGFAYANCPSVIMSLWSIDDKATSVIISSFYKNLNKTQAKHEALRQAKLTYLADADPVQAHPYYWASLSLIGDTSAIIVKKSAIWLWGVLALVIFGGGVFLVKNRKTEAQNVQMPTE